MANYFLHYTNSSKKILKIYCIYDIYFIKIKNKYDSNLNTSNFIFFYFIYTKRVYDSFLKKFFYKIPFRLLINQTNTGIL